MDVRKTIEKNFNLLVIRGHKCPVLFYFSKNALQLGVQPNKLEDLNLMPPPPPTSNRTSPPSHLTSKKTNGQNMPILWCLGYFPIFFIFLEFKMLENINRELSKKKSIWPNIWTFFIKHLKNCHFSAGSMKSWSLVYFLPDCTAPDDGKVRKYTS